MKSKIRVLCLDIEGGYGGSSRSLFQSVRHIDRNQVEVEVWCKRKGSIQDRYSQIGIPCRVEPDIPRFSALPRFSRNIYDCAGALVEFYKGERFRQKLLEAASSRFDVIHYNHEGLYLLAAWLRKKNPAVLQSMHVRTRPVPTIFYSWQVRKINQALDQLIFITENEQQHFIENGGTTPGEVIFNVVPLFDDSIEPHSLPADDHRFKIVSISNFALERGTDRLAEIAQALSKKRRNDIVFIVAGQMKLSPSMPGLLGRVAKQGGDFSDVIQSLGLADNFVFLGHVSEPERVLAAADILLKPAHGNNPWGRDVLESLAAGKPVVATGSYSTFVEDGVTGFLEETYDSDRIAEKIIRLADAPELLRDMGVNGRKRVKHLCDGATNSAKLLTAWRQLCDQGSVKNGRP